MAEAHLVIARSGAGTVAELMAIGRPAILVPLPACAGRQPDAQCRNPRARRCRLDAWRSRDLSPDTLAQMLTEIFAAPADLAGRAAAAHALAMPDAAQKLADMVETCLTSRQRTAA